MMNHDPDVLMIYLAPIPYPFIATLYLLLSRVTIPSTAAFLFLLIVAPLLIFDFLREAFPVYD